MTTKQGIIKSFVQNFIQREKRDRCYLQLITPSKRSKFLQVLNHRWGTVLDMRYLTQVESAEDNAEHVSLALGLAEDEPCYVICDGKEYDDQMLPFKEAIAIVHRHSFATLLVNRAGTVMFLGTEQARGGTARFIGRRLFV